MAVDVNGSQDAGRLEARGVGNHRRHFDAHGAGPGGAYESRVPGEGQTLVLWLIEEGEAAKGEFVGQHEGGGSGGDWQVLALPGAEAPGGLGTQVGDLVDDQPDTTIGAGNDEDLQNLRLSAPSSGKSVRAMPVGSPA